MDKKDIIFGVRPILEAIESGTSIDKIFIKRDATGELLDELKEKSRNYDIPIFKVPVEKLNRITKKNHQGAIAYISPVGYCNPDNLISEIYASGRDPFVVILDGLTDARNFGAIARTCECAGVDFIIIPERGSVSVTSDAVKASAGALYHIPVCRVKNIAEAVILLQRNGLKVYGASEKGNLNYAKADFTGPVAIIMGSEENGLSTDVLKSCDSLIYIPIQGKIGSLNVSVAAGIIIYEVVDKRSFTEDI